MTHCRLALFGIVCAVLAVALLARYRTNVAPTDGSGGAASKTLQRRHRTDVAETESAAGSQLSAPRASAASVDARTSAADPLFAAGGEMRSWGGHVGAVEVEFVWESTQTTRRYLCAGDTLAGWSTEFPSQGEFVLVSVQSSTTQLDFLGAPRVSAANPSADITLIEEGWTRIVAVDASSQALIARPLELHIRPKQGRDDGSYRVRSGRDTTYRGGIQIMRDLENPATISDFTESAEVEVRCEGYHPGSFVVDAERRSEVIELEPQGGLLVELSGRAGVFAVEVAFGEGPLHRFPEVVSPGWAPVLEVTDQERARIVVREFVEVGRGAIVAEASMDVGPHATATSRVVVPPRTDGLTKTGAITVTVIGDIQGPSAASWYATLTPTPAPPVYPDVEHPYPVSQVAGWEPVQPGRQYRQRFEGLATGGYKLVISPIGITKDVEITPGGDIEVQMELGAPAILRVWPVDKGNDPITDSNAVGVLGWFPVPEGTRASFAASGDKATLRQELYAAAVEARTFQGAQWHPDGCWEIYSSAGSEIMLLSIAPRVLGAETKFVEMATGPMDTTLQFSGLE